MGAKRIEKLTKEHRASFTEWVDRWTAIGRSTEPMDRERAAAGVASAYKAAGLSAPTIFWAGSPMSGAIMRDMIVSVLQDRATNSVLDDDAWRGVADAVRAKMQNGVALSMPASWQKECIWGCHDAGWLGFYDWFAHHGLADICAPLYGLTEVARSAGWWWAHRSFAVVSDRPSVLHDELIGPHRRRLHNPNGPSVTYRDGWSCWHWHGLSVPRWVIEEPTIERIMAEANVEVRRAAIESLGWDHLLDHMVLVDHDDDPHRGDLYNPPAIWAADNDAAVRVLIVRNGTPAPDGSWPQYGLTVPAEVSSVAQAQDWLAGVDGLVLARRT
jgi:hypothetical protein